MTDLFFAFSLVPYYKANARNEPPFSHDLIVSPTKERGRLFLLRGLEDLGFLLLESRNIRQWCTTSLSLLPVISVLDDPI